MVFQPRGQRLMDQLRARQFGFRHLASEGGVTERVVAIGNGARIPIFASATGARLSIRIGTGDHP